MTVLGEVLLVTGAAWSVLAAIGVNRFGDVYARMHAATKTTTLGVLLVLLGAAIGLEPVEAVKLLLAAVLLFLTAPIGAHLVGRSVHRNVGAAAMTIDSVDELRDFDPDSRTDTRSDDEH